MEESSVVLDTCLESSFCLESESQLLDSLKFEINLKEEERTAYLESSRKSISTSSSSIELFESSTLISSSESSKYESVTEDEDYCKPYSEPLEDDDGFKDFSSWAQFSLDSEFWDEDYDLEESRPVSYSELKLTAKELSGILTPRIVATCLSHLAQLPGQSKHVFTKFQLPNKNLFDIRVLEKFKDLMYVDLSNNKIEEMGIFSKMHYLVYLNLENNEIAELDIKDAKPFYLTYLNVSKNQIEYMPDFDSLWSLTHLDLSNNRITEISGLWALRHLKLLNLSYNNIRIFDVRLFSMNIRDLDISYNEISEWSAPDNDMIIAQTLFKFNICHNQLTNLEELKMVYWIEELDVSCNCIAEVENVYYLSNMKSLHTLNIDGNKLWDTTDARGLVIYLVPSLITINSLSVTMNERMNAADLFNNNLVHRAFQIYSWLLAKRHMSEPSTHPTDPTIRVWPRGKNLLVLVGPPGSCKWKIIKKLSERFPDYVRMGKLVTTRPMCGSHMKQVSLECFNYLIDSGQVITYEFRLGAGFAFCWDELNDVGDGQMMLIGLELSAALCLIWQGLRPTLILTITKDQDLHVERLKQLCREYDYSNTAEKSISDCFIFDEDGNLTPEEEKKEEVNLTSNEPSTSQTETFSSDVTAFRSEGTTSSKSNDSVSDIKYVATVKTANCPCKNDIPAKGEKINEHYGQDSSWTLNENNNLQGNIIQSVFKKSKENQVADPVLKTSSESLSDYLSICITEEEVNEEEPIDEEYVQNHLFIDSLTRSRDEYIDVHHKMPGLFRNSVLTDNVKESQKKLAHIIQEILYDDHRNTLDNELFYEPRKDPLFDEMVQRNVDIAIKKLTQGYSMATLLPVEPKQDLKPSKRNFYFNK